MRAIRSLSGSLMDMRSPSPARLHKARDQALGAKFAQRDAAKLVLAVERARPAGQLATIADARRRRIARHLGKLQARGEALFHRPGLVHDDRFEAVATSARLLRH